MIPRLHPDPRLSSLVWKTGDTYLPLDDPLYFPRTIRFEFYLFLSLSIVLSWEEENFLKFVIARVYFFPLFNNDSDIRYVEKRIFYYIHRILFEQREGTRY